MSCDQGTGWLWPLWTTMTCAIGYQVRCTQRGIHLESVEGLAVPVPACLSGHWQSGGESGSAQRYLVKTFGVFWGHVFARNLHSSRTLFAWFNLYSLYLQFYLPDIRYIQHKIADVTEYWFLFKACVWKLCNVWWSVRFIYTYRN